MKINRLEGSGAARFVQLMRQHGYNKDIEIQLGKVTKISPIEISLESGIALEEDDLIIAEGLSKLSLAVDDQVILYQHERSGIITQ